MELEHIFNKVKNASRELAFLKEEKVNSILRDLADEIVKRQGEILVANMEDLSRMDLSNPMYDRLKLTSERIEGIASDTRHVATLPSPLGRVLKHSVLPNGLDLTRISVPFGVIGIIYEARPNVTVDVASLCLKSGNACVLKGGKDADDSNRVIVKVIREVLERHEVNPDAVTLLPATHEATGEMLHAVGFIDVVIPRGSSRLIKFVRENATIPVIETGAGICHCYFDEYGDLEKGIRIINNAKTRRVSVCNALDCVVLHASRLDDLAALCAPLADSKVIIYADELSYSALVGKYPAELLEHATLESFGTEFQAYKMAVRTVESFAEALDYIANNSSKHSESIVTENEERAETFLMSVDAACVYANAPTSFTDGAQFGLGAEIGISTQAKLSTISKGSRCSVWLGCRDWYQYPEIACSWPNGLGGNDYIQMGYPWKRADSS